MSPLTRRLVCILAVALLFTWPEETVRARHVATDANFDATGMEAGKSYFSQFPFESIDMTNGMLSLSFTDLELPGNAGMNLRIGRTYTRQQLRQWEFGVIGMPVRVVFPDGPGITENYPKLFTMDGMSHEAYPSSTDVEEEEFITREFWRYHTNDRTVELPNGWVGEFEEGETSGGAMLVRIHNVFSTETTNYITFDWNGISSLSTQRPLTLNSVTQHFSATLSRTVEFDYEDADCPIGMPSKMSYGDLYWNYSCSIPTDPEESHLFTMTPPTGTGPGWAYLSSDDITDGTLKVTTPNGGWILYDFAPKEFIVGSNKYRATVQARTTGGREVAGGVWSFTYSQVSPGMVGTVFLPGEDQRSIVFEHEVDPNNGWMLAEKRLRIGITTPVDVSIFHRDNIDIDFLAGRVIQRPEVETITIKAVSGVTGGVDRVYTREYCYHTSDDVFADFGQAYKITEGGDFTRTTARLFDDTLTLWNTYPIRQVTTTVGAQSFTSNWDPDQSTGFIEKTTIRGVVTEFDPDGDGNVEWAKDGRGNVTSFEYEWGVLKKTTTEEGHITLRGIDPDGTVSSEARDGHTTGFDYDDQFRLTKVQPPLVDSKGAPTETAYAADGSFVRVFRGPTNDQRFTKTLLDGFGRPRGTENAEGIKTRVLYDAEGRVTFQSLPFIGDAVGPGQEFEYDPLGRIRTVTRANGVEVSYEYANPSTGGDTIKETEDLSDQSDRITLQTWFRTGGPSGGRLMSLKDAENETWAYTYNALDLITTLDEPGAPSHTWTYYATGQLQSETHPESGTTSYVYDGAGNVECRTDAKGQLFIYAYDEDNRLVGIDAPGTDYDITQVVDNTRNNRTQLQTGPTGNHITTVFTYDAANRLERRVDSVGGHSFETEFEYDAFDNLSKLTYPSGREVRYYWDKADRVSRVSETSGMDWANYFSHDVSGALEGYTAANTQTVLISYDSQSLLPEVIASGPVSLNYEYYKSGDVKEITDSRGTGYTQGFTEYDRVDRLKTATGLGAGTFTYTPRGDRESKNSVSYTYSGVRLRSDGTTAYDDDETNGNIDQIGSRTFEFTPFNMPWKVTKSGEPTTYYRYDGDGERRVREISGTKDYFIPGLGFEPLAEYKESSGNLSLIREYIYANGQLIASIGKASIPTATFTDDPVETATTSMKAVHFTELRAAINAARAAVGLSAATWTDGTVTADSTMVKAVHITEMRTALNSVYANLGAALPTYTDSTLTAGTTIAKAAHLQELRAAHAALVTTNLIAKSYYHLDAVGSVRAVTDGAGNVVRRHDYTAFGEELSPVAGADSRRFGGKERDPETGLDYFSARYYAPGIGRFARADDLGFGVPFGPQSMNQYGFTMGNPLRWTDPSGHQAKGPEPPCKPSSTTACVYAPKPETITIDVFEREPFGLNLFEKQRSPPGGHVPGNPCIFAGTSMSPTQYAGFGKVARYDPAKILADAADFRKGRFFDAQVGATGTAWQRASYGNYTYGVYTEAAGIPLTAALGAAAGLAATSSRYPKDTVMNNFLRFLPQANVMNISHGWNDQRQGSTCQK